MIKHPVPLALSRIVLTDKSDDYMRSCVKVYNVDDSDGDDEVLWPCFYDMI